MEWIIWILVIIAVVAIVVWMLRKNSGPTAGGNTPEQRHPGNQPGSGANEPIVEAGPPVSNTPAAGTAGAAAAGSVTAAGAERDTNAATANDERWQTASSDPVDRPTAPDRGARHTTAADGTVDDSAGRGAVPPAGQEDEHNAMGRHNLGEDSPWERDDDSLGSANIGEDQPGDPDYDSLGSSNIGGPHTEQGHHSLGSHNLGEGDDAIVEDPTPPATRRQARQDAQEHKNDADRDKGTP